MDEWASLLNNHFSEVDESLLVVEWGSRVYSTISIDNILEW